VTHFGPLTCSVVTTTRKFFTILGSVLIFRHPLTALQWTATLLVFAGLSLDSAFGKAGKDKTSSQKNGGNYDVSVDEMLTKNGLVRDQQVQNKLKTN